jgi:hypothetical protein
MKGSQLFWLSKSEGMTVDIWITDYNPPMCFQKKISGRSKHNVQMRRLGASQSVPCTHQMGIKAQRALRIPDFLFPIMIHSFIHVKKLKYWNQLNNVAPGAIFSTWRPWLDIRWWCGRTSLAPALNIDYLLMLMPGTCHPVFGHTVQCSRQGVLAGCPAETPRGWEALLKIF